MSVWERVTTRNAAIAAYRDGPVAFSLSTLILLGAIACAVILGMRGKVPLMLNAAIHILPAVILTLGNLYRRAQHLERWPRWLVIAGIAVAATVILRMPADYFLGLGVMGEFSIWISAVALVPAILMLIVTLLPPALTSLASGLKRIPVAGALLGRWLPAPVLYALLLAVWNVALLFTLHLDGIEYWIVGIFAIAMFATATGFRNSLFASSQETFLWRLLPHIPAWLWGAVPLANQEELLGFEAK